MDIDWKQLEAIESRMVDEPAEIERISNQLNSFRLNEKPDAPYKQTGTKKRTVEDLRRIIAAAGTRKDSANPNTPTREYTDDELTFWSALISDYEGVVTRIPRYAKVMIWSGIPDSFRGEVWISLSQALRNDTVYRLYESLAAEWTPSIKIINRDLNRTFPKVAMFKEANGKGQVKLGRVLSAYSAYDVQLGYCQGLTFIAAIILMHIENEAEAFSVLVHLMEDCGFREMFTCDFAGLKLRSFQFEELFKEYLPELWAHFQALAVPNVFLSQWFLSFFGSTCPLEMLVRIYDLVFAEGGPSTMMKVSLAVLKRNESILRKFDSEEDILERLLNKSLWDVYGFDDDLLISDITSVAKDSFATRLSELEAGFRRKKLSEATSPATVSAGLNLDEETNAGISESVETSPPSLFRFWRKESSATNSGSITSGTSDASVYRTSSLISSLSEMDDPRETYELKLELQCTRHALSTEQQERKRDRELVTRLLKSLDDTDLLQQVKDRFGYETNDDKEKDTANSKDVEENKCSNCETLLMEMAVLKSNEITAKQTIDDLNERLMMATPTKSWWKT